MTPGPTGDGNLPDRRERGDPSGQPEYLQETVEFWAGPMPSPETLQQFNDAIPGSGDLIVQEFREQGQHRREIEQRESKSYAFGVRASATIPPLIDALLIIGGVTSILAGRVVTGAILVILEMLMVFIIRMSYRPVPTPPAPAPSSTDSLESEPEDPNPEV